MIESYLARSTKILEVLKENIVLNIMVACIGLLLCTYGMYVAINLSHMKKGSLETTGEVVSVINDQSSGKQHFFPVIEFADKNGMSITFRDLKGAKHPKYNKGEYVQVLYYPLSPGKAFINNTKPNYIVSAFLLLLGISFLWGSVHNILGIKSRATASANC